MQETPLLETAATGILEPALEAAGYGVICTKLLAGGRYQTLQIMAERIDGRPMTVQDCVAISHEAGKHLESAGISPEYYTLEVCSPGEDRPLVRIADFEKFTGRMAMIEMRAPVGGHRQFQGHIVRVREREKGAELELNTPSGSVRIPVGGIAEARLAADKEPPAEEK